MLKPGFSGGYCTTAHGLIHYVELDTRNSKDRDVNERTIVMLHQGGSSWREFVAVASLLKGWRVLMPDIPGHGNSTECRNATIEIYATAIQEFIDGLTIDRLSLFGHHFGGVVAAEVAVLLGERVEHLIMSNTPFVDEYARRLRESEEPRSYIPTQANGSHLEKLWTSRIALYQGDTVLANRYIAENLLLGPAVENAHSAVAQYHMEKRFNKYNGRISYIHGASDPYIAVEIEHALMMFQPDDLTTIPQGTVALVDQFPEEVAGVIQRRTT